MSSLKHRNNKNINTFKASSLLYTIANIFGFLNAPTSIWRQLKSPALKVVPVSTCRNNFHCLAVFYWPPTGTLDKLKTRMSLTLPRLKGLKEWSGSASQKDMVLEGKSPERHWTALPVDRWFSSSPGRSPSQHHCNLPVGAAMDTGRKEPSVR